MKKIFILIVIVIGGIFLFQKKELRVRIIANSNTTYDQSIKIKIAEELKDYLKQDRSLDETKEFVNKILKDYNVSYKCNVVIRKEKFSPKKVNDKVIPGGKYKTLVIELGEATGKNYWSLLYPEYFNISFEDETDVEVGFWLEDIFRRN